ncbi:hypothetical protein ACFR9U_06910 [Halorientalis brevis]|uniref:Uncharacterized protein n=1 Tax=Halorientalis brevis TaxID=1126241 RepID=A0ABD6C8N6_9EURY|nr:hypothetical protein [Halorientalis brevis]
MSEPHSVNEVEQGDDYYHVRYRDPDDFDEIRTPDWAENAASSVVTGSEVRTGDETGNEDWAVQSVLIPVDAVSEESDAKEAARQIVDEIES